MTFLCFEKFTGLSNVTLTSSPIVKEKILSALSCEMPVKEMDTKNKASTVFIKIKD